MLAANFVTVYKEMKGFPAVIIEF